MTDYKQITVLPSELANALNSLRADNKIIHYVIPSHEYDGTLIVIVFGEVNEND